MMASTVSVLATPVSPAWRDGRFALALLTDPLEAMNTNQTPDRDWIKEEAKRRREDGESCTVSDLIVLANQNDPFYQGTSTDQQKAAWFADVWERAGYTGEVHLRRMHYWCVSQRDLEHYNGEPYRNTEKHWTKLASCAKKARYLGFVSFKKIADHRNPDPHLFVEGEHPSPRVEVHPNDPADYSVLDFGFNPQRLQPYHLEVWCEKSTMDDVLRPVCQQNFANLVTGEGELSITACHNLAQRIKQVSKPTRIFYISDFDPAGKSMPRAVARKLEWMIEDEGIMHDVRLVPLVLTQSQIREYDLPREPIKKSELRRKSFEEAHGEGAVELDALEALYPGTLGDILREALSDYVNGDARRAMNRAQRAIKDEVREKVEDIQDEYRKHIEALREMNQRINQVGVDDPQEHIPDPPDLDPEGDRTREWLYQSRRSYFDQLDTYERYGEGEL